VDGETEACGIHERLAGDPNMRSRYIFSQYLQPSHHPPERIRNLDENFFLFIYINSNLLSTEGQSFLNFFSALEQLALL